MLRSVARKNAQARAAQSFSCMRASIACVRVSVTAQANEHARMGVQDKSYGDAKSTSNAACHSDTCIWPCVANFDKHAGALPRTQFYPSPESA
eukprot:3894662-Pleurochrysis_carterae.AAC.1